VKVETPAKVISDRLHKKGNESAEVFRGSSNIDLSPQGVQEAHGAAQRTAGQFTEIHASPLKRAQDTAKIVSRANPQAGPIKTTPALEPWFLGQHEGQAVTPERLADINDRIRNRPNDPVPGRGPQSTGAGESFNQFKDPLIQHVQQQLANFQPGQKPLNVTHYRDVQAVKAWLKAGHPPTREVDPDEMASKGSQHPGDLFRLHPADMRLTPAKDAKQDGLYFLRHGATAWNAENSGPSPKSVQKVQKQSKNSPGSPKLMADGGTVTPGMRTMPVVSASPKLPTVAKPADPNIAVRSAMKDITRRASSGDIRGALSTGAQHIGSGLLRPEHVDRAMDMAGPEAIKAGFNALPELHQAVSIFRNAAPEHQALLRPLLHQRIVGMERRPVAEQRAVMAKLAEHGMMPGRQI